MIIATVNIWGGAPQWQARREILCRSLPELDILLLQQVKRTKDSDQAGEIAHKLKFYHRAIEFSGDTAVAILSRTPLSDIGAQEIRGSGSQRSALTARTRTGEREVAITSVELSASQDKLSQLDQLLKANQERQIIGGTLNIRDLKLSPPFTLAGSQEPTWPAARQEELLAALADKENLASLEAQTVDYLIGRSISWRNAFTIEGRENDISASDHAALIAEF